MGKFKVKEICTVKIIYEYEVESETQEEAIEKFCNELSGSIEPINEYHEGEPEVIDIVPG